MDVYTQMKPSCAPTRLANFFKSQFGRLEWLQRGWLEEAAFRLPKLITAMEAFSRSCTEASSWPTLKEFPVLLQSLETVAIPVSAQDKVRAALGLFSEASIGSAFIEQVVDLYRRYGEIVPNQVKGAIRELAWVWHFREIDPIARDWGRRQIFFDGSKRIIDSFQLNPADFPIKRDEAALEYLDSEETGTSVQCGGLPIFQRLASQCKVNFRCLERRENRPRRHPC